MKISYLITTYNRAIQLNRTLKRLSRLTKPDELVVIDDGSTDGTRDVVEGARALLGIPVQYIFRNKQGYDSCAIPRNIGIKHCTHEFLAICEPECLFITDVIAQFKEAVQVWPSHVATAGLVYFTNPDTAIDDGVAENPMHYIESVWDVKKFPMHPEDQIHEHGRPVVYTQATVTRALNMTAPFAAFYKKEWLFEISGWDENFSLIHGGGGWGFDDTDLLTRLRIKGHGQDIDSQIQVIHQWHDRPPGKIADGWKRNEELMGAKNLTDNPNNPNLVANQGREWGKL